MFEEENHGSEDLGLKNQEQENQTPESQISAEADAESQSKNAGGETDISPQSAEDADDSSAPYTATPAISHQEEPASRNQAHNATVVETHPEGYGVETGRTYKFAADTAGYPALYAIASKSSKKPKSGRMEFATALVVLCLIVSAASGFGGAYLANYLWGNPVSPATTVTEPSQALTIVEIAALTSESVVEIYTETVVNIGRFGSYIAEGAGSGVIISSDGYIVTNNHVIEGASKITVRLKNGVEHEAALIGRDSKTDLAVLKIQESGLQSAVFGDSDKLVVGELVVAIGNPLGKLGGTVTDGIISALSRNISVEGQMMNLLQTSAAVNPGNSGGGLFNRYGELIGIVNAKSSGSDIEGLGFAIPINVVKSAIEDIVTIIWV